MKELSTSFCLSNGWELFKKYGLTLSVVYLAYSVIQQLFYLPINIVRIANIGTAYNYGYGYDYGSATPLFLQGTSVVVMIPCTLIATLFTYVFLFGFIGTVLRLTAGTQTDISFSIFKQPLSAYLKFIGAYIIYSFAVGVGCLFCIIPGIYLAVKLIFVPYYILDHPEASIEDALKAGWRMTNGNFWNIFVMQLSCLGIAIIGLLLCCIGTIAAAPYCHFIVATAYYELSGNLEASENAGYNRNE